MTNLFLLNSAFDASTLEEFEKGLLRLITLHTRATEDECFFKHPSIWEHSNSYGTTTQFYHSIINPQIARQLPRLLGSMHDTQYYLSDCATFDQQFPRACNGFLGIDFSECAIPDNRQVTTVEALSSFKVGCIQDFEVDSIEEFWVLRDSLFPSIVFCEHVRGQIEHLSITDNRFKLICDKLRRLDTYASIWSAQSEGVFQYAAIGVECSPDTPTRIKSTLEHRTFHCPDIGPRVFSLHLKWWCGAEPFRLYFFPDPASRSVFVGYIGGKAGMGF